MTPPHSQQPRPRVALVTGANRGLGLAIVRQLARQEALDVVVLSARDEPSGRAAAEHLQASGLGKVVFHPLDVTDATSIAALVEWLEATHGGLDVLVNNAGVAFEGFDAQIVARTLAVNFYGPLALTQALLPSLHRGARVVMVSSGVADLATLEPHLRKRFVRVQEEGEVEALVRLVETFAQDVAQGRHAAMGWPSSAYRVSKLALNALTAILARELASDPRGILINAVCPGWVRTDMGGEAAPRSVEQGAETPVWAALLPEGGPSGGFFRDREPADW